MEKKTILIAEDNAIMREGLKSLLPSLPGLTVVGEATDGKEAIRKVTELKPDLVLLDLTMPKLNGLDAISDIRRSHPQVKILVLTVHDTEEYVLASLKAGVDGYALKESSYEELVLAIQTVLEGKPFLSPGISKEVIQGYLAAKKEENTEPDLTTLTQRQREILKLIAENYKSREIAECLCISLKTVEKHRHSLMKRLDLHSASALTTYAIKHGLVTK